MTGRVWRQGRKVGRTIYLQRGADASDDDPLIGVMDTPTLAEHVVAAVNAAADDDVDPKHRGAAYWRGWADRGLAAQAGGGTSPNDPIGRSKVGYQEQRERAAQRALSSSGHIGAVAQLIVGVCSDLSMPPSAHARKVQAVAERLAVAIDTDPNATAGQLRCLARELEEATR